MPRFSIVVVLICCALFTTSCPAQSTGALPDDLRSFESVHYIIHTDLDEALAGEMSHRMDVMWEQYAQRFGDFAPPVDAPKLEAYLFARRADYAHLTGDRFPNTAGIFMPQRRLLAAFLEGQGRQGIRRTLQHEAFHQFAQAYIGGHLPIWLNEGIAQIFEEGIWTGDTFLLGQVPPTRIAQLRDQIRSGNITPFDQFMTRTDEQWASELRFKPLAQAQYNQAWAMAQFLIFAADDEGAFKFRDRVLNMLQMIHQGQDGQAAFVAAFSANIAGFQNMFLNWAQTLSPTEAAAYNQHQSTLADMLVSLDRQGVSVWDINSLRRCLETGAYQLQTPSGPVATETFFCDLVGRPLTTSQLCIVPDPETRLPDLICHPADQLLIKTRFVRNNDGALDYETTVRAD